MVLATAVIALGGCGGASKKPAPAGGTATSAGTSSSATLTPFLAHYRVLLTARLHGIVGVPRADVSKIVNCTIKKLASQGVTTANAPHGAHLASVDSEACARALGLH